MLIVLAAKIKNAFILPLYYKKVNKTGELQYDIKF